MRNINYVSHFCHDVLSLFSFSCFFFQMPEHRIGGMDRDEAASWLRWIKTVPAPLIVDLSRLRDT